MGTYNWADPFATRVRVPLRLETGPEQQSGAAAFFATSPVAVPDMSGSVVIYPTSARGQLMANRKPYRHSQLTVAHATLPLGSKVTITANGKSVEATVTDRGGRKNLFVISGGVANALDVKAGDRVDAHIGSAPAVFLPRSPAAEVVSAAPAADRAPSVRPDPAIALERAPVAAEALVDVDRLYQRRWHARANYVHKGELSTASFHPHFYMRTNPRTGEVERKYSNGIYGSEDMTGFPVVRGEASVYGFSHAGRDDGFAQKATANKEVMDPDVLTVAMPEYRFDGKIIPLNTLVEITDTQTGRKVVARVNDRGPYADARYSDAAHDRRVLDMSPANAEALGWMEKRNGRWRAVLPSGAKTALPQVEIRVLGPAFTADGNRNLALLQQIPDENTPVERDVLAASGDALRLYSLAEVMRETTYIAPVMLQKAPYVAPVAARVPAMAVDYNQEYDPLLNLPRVHMAQESVHVSRAPALHLAQRTFISMRQVDDECCDETGITRT